MAKRIPPYTFVQVSVVVKDEYSTVSARFSQNESQYEGDIEPDLASTLLGTLEAISPPRLVCVLAELITLNGEWNDVSSHVFSEAITKTEHALGQAAVNYLEAWEQHDEEKREASDG